MFILTKVNLVQLQNTSNNLVKCFCTQVAHSSPLDELLHRISKKQLLPDDHQMKVAEELEKIHGTVKGYKPDPPASKFSRWLPFGKLPNLDPPKGLYIFGSVGGGKTMLMDLFYDCCEVILDIIKTMFRLCDLISKFSFKDREEKTCPFQRFYDGCA